MEQVLNIFKLFQLFVAIQTVNNFNNILPSRLLVERMKSICIGNERGTTGNKYFCPSKIDRASEAVKNIIWHHDRLNCLRYIWQVASGMVSEW